MTRDGWNLAAGAEEWFAPVHTQVGPDGAVWFSDWYNFIIQHNPTPQGFTNGTGNAYESSLRDHQRGRIYPRRLQGRGARRSDRSRRRTRPGPSSALASDNMLWRLTAQRLIVERGQKDLVPQLQALVKNTSVDAIGINGGAMHALWTLKGLGELDRGEQQLVRGGGGGAEASRGGRAQRRRRWCCRRPRRRRPRCWRPTCSRMPTSTRGWRRRWSSPRCRRRPTSRKALYRESQKTDNYTDKWLSRAFYIAALRHKTFTTAYKADKNALPFDSLPVALRLGALKPDWRAPNAKDVAADWKEMQVAGQLGVARAAGFRRRRLVHADDRRAGGGRGTATLSLGAMRNTGEVWVNGLVHDAAGRRPREPAVDAAVRRRRSRSRQARSSGGPEPDYRCASECAQRRRLHRHAGADVSRAGGNKMPRLPAVEVPRRAADQRRHALLQAGRAGRARRVHRRRRSRGRERARRSSRWRRGSGRRAAITAVPASSSSISRSSRSAPGQLVEIVFTNPDAMQHNFVLGASGALERARHGGRQAGAVAGGSRAAGRAGHAAGALLDEARRAGRDRDVPVPGPVRAGDYPYLCTFPAHWRVMNGVLHVVQPQGRGGRGDLVRELVAD